MTKTRKIITFVIAIAAPVLLGMLSSFISGDIGAVYDRLQTPPLSPPNWVFGVVWPILYIMMGVALGLVLTNERRPERVRSALVVFIIQLVLNIAWSPVFFGLLAYWPAVVIVVAMDVMLIATIVLFARVNKVAAWLLVPYLAWILFASYLTLGVALMN